LKCILRRAISPEAIRNRHSALRGSSRKINFNSFVETNEKNQGVSFSRYPTEAMKRYRPQCLKGKIKKNREVVFIVVQLSAEAKKKVAIPQLEKF
jgi:hypothetical protein